jgi:hypothetical protein
MHATTCERSSALIFRRWYARSSWRSIFLRNETHVCGESPIRNRPSIAPRGGRGLGGRQPSSCPSAFGTYAVVSRDPVPVARSKAPLPRLEECFFADAPAASAEDATPLDVRLDDDEDD